MSDTTSTTVLEEVSAEEAIRRLDSNQEEGLSEEEAQRRLKQYGENSIEEERENPVKKLLRHFWGPIPWMIEAAVILSAIAGRWEDFAVIFTMLLINGGVSFWHESKAEGAIQALKEQLSPEARVVRQGKRRTFPAKKLVPGDLVVLRMGDVVPADAKLLADQHLSVDESALTGESLPVDKEEGGVIYSGTTVKRGEARAVVTATGRDTKFAQTVELVESAQEISHFQRAVLRIGYFLIGGTGVMVALIVGTGIWRGDPAMDVLLFALVVTIAGIPQALPAVLTVTMTVGANRLARMKAIVSRLAAMEEMAGLRTLCADKTGTLTKNELELQEPVVLAADDRSDLVLTDALTCRSDEEDPIDNAVLDALENRAQLDRFEVKEFRPFDPTRKRAEADVSRDGEEFTAAKGAPQVILDLVGASDQQREEIGGKVDELGKGGYRALGVARKPAGGKWEYLGILPLLDPPRDDTAKVLGDAREHGIDVRMVTGDHAAIARQVAEQVGLGADIPDASGFFEEESKDRQRIEEVDGFAQVTPEHKFRIIQHFQRDDRIVGMTGDGVNDAPALKQANVGIAVAGATDAARAAADLVLTEKGLGVITHAVEEARRIFERMISYATFRITETTRMVLFFTLCILIFDFYPVTPIMIVLLAILNDIPIMTIASDNVPTARHPVRWNMRRVLTVSSVLGIAGVISSFILYWFLRTQMELTSETIQTMIFLKLLVAGHMTLFLTRNTGPLWQQPYPSLTLIAALEGTQIVGTLAAVYGWLVHPIGWGYALGIWGYAACWILILSGVNILTYRLMGEEQ